MKRWMIISLSAIVLVVLVFMAVSTLDRDKATFVSDALGVVTTPVQKFFSGIGNAVSGGFGYFESLDSLREEQTVLQSKIEALEQGNRELESLKSENKRLTALLEMKDKNPQFEMTGARVVARDSTQWSQSFFIDKGTAAGLSKNCVVLTEEGVVGYINEIGTSWARVVSIIDADSSAGAIVERTGDRGLAEGDLELSMEGLCKMTYVSKQANLVPGDYVETSGIGVIFPPGLYIGRIREVETQTQGISQSAIVEPAVDFSKLSEVLVIKDVYQPVEDGE